MKYTLKAEDIANYNDSTPFDFPKYTSQLINLANQNAQGTRPRVVGQMSELFPEFVASGQEITRENWRNWYVTGHPQALETATDRIYCQVQNLRQAIADIDRAMVAHWVEDLVIDKTLNGLYVQKAILASLAQRQNTTYRLATPAEEAAGIDGYVGNVAYSIKPYTYKTMERLPETIRATMIYYTKAKNGLTIEVEE